MQSSPNWKVFMPSNKKTYEEILKEDGSLTYISYGYSMYPLIKEKEDILHIVSIKEDPKKGDIVLYKDKEHHYVLHRILKIKKDGNYLLAGDHNYWKDPLIRKENIIGLLTDITKKDGKKIILGKDKKFHAWVCLHLFHVKSLYLMFLRLLHKIFRK